MKQIVANLYDPRETYQQWFICWWKVLLFPIRALLAPLVDDDSLYCIHSHKGVIKIVGCIYQEGDKFLVETFKHPRFDMRYPIPYSYTWHNTCGWHSTAKVPEVTYHAAPEGDGVVYLPMGRLKHTNHVMTEHEFLHLAVLSKDDLEFNKWIVYTGM